jgi:hypothetical protein
LSGVTFASAVTVVTGGAGSCAPDGDEAEDRLVHPAHDHLRGQRRQRVTAGHHRRIVLDHLRERGHHRGPALDRGGTGGERLDDADLSRTRRGRERPDERAEAGDHLPLERRLPLGGRLHRVQQRARRGVERRQEGVVLVGEQLVERAPRDARPADDVLDAHAGVPRRGRGIDRRHQDPAALVVGHERPRQPVTTRWKLSGARALRGTGV